VDWVTNMAPAFGGTDSEDLEHAKWRGPQVLQTRERAVTADDFEYLANQATPMIARARCAAPGRLDRNGSNGHIDPGVVRVLLVPALAPSELAPRPDQLQPPLAVRQEVHAYLAERRLLACELLLDTPTYTWVVILSKLRCRPEADRDRVDRDATAMLYRYVHPVFGGTDGKGWPFGRELLVGELYSLLQQIPDVAYVEEIILQEVNPLTREFGPSVARVSPGADGLLASFEHRVDVQPVTYPTPALAAATA
jgi:predicted phage baseplate assembly protein